MRSSIFIFVCFLTTLAHAQETIYLTCHGFAKDMGLNQDLGETDNDFLLDKTAMTIQQIITGMTEEETTNLRQDIVETTTQYITKNGRIAINKHTLEYSASGIMGFSVRGKCEVVQPTI